MHLFSTEEDYSYKKDDDDFYGEVKITYGSDSDDDSTSGSPSSSGPYDDYQNERHNIVYNGYDQSR